MHLLKMKLLYGSTFHELIVVILLDGIIFLTNWDNIRQNVYIFTGLCISGSIILYFAIHRSCSKKPKNVSSTEKKHLREENN
jgi:hypothetical protein